MPAEEFAVSPASVFLVPLFKLEALSPLLTLQTHSGYLPIVPRRSLLILGNEETLILPERAFQAEE